MYPLSIGFIALTDLQQVGVALETCCILSCPNFEYMAKSKFAVSLFYILNSKYPTYFSGSLEYTALCLDSHVLQIEICCGYYEGDKLELVVFSCVFTHIFWLGKANLSICEIGTYIFI